MNCVGGWRSS